MSFRLSPFSNIGLTSSLLEHLIDEHETVALPEYDTYWQYYRNPTVDAGSFQQSATGPNGRTAQAKALPARLTQPSANGSPKEIVIVNEIAWRVETLADYMCAGGVRMISSAPDASRRDVLESVAAGVLNANGGTMMLQELSLLGSIYGHVDLLVQRHPSDMTASAAPTPSSNGPVDGEAHSQALEAARQFRFELIEAPRAIPILDPDDYTHLLGYILYYRKWDNVVDEPGFLERAARAAGIWRGSTLPERSTTAVVEIWSANHHQVYEGDSLVLDESNALGVVPIAHIQNLPQPYFYEGLSDVEPLISLQDELNIRLSDRANRITLQSFQMYLGKGIEGFGERPVGPGQMWMTDNPDASIEAFGGDSSCPDERQHLDDIRSAMDKISSVSPLAAGLLHTKVGTLSSENALRISLLGILSKTERRRQLYGRGLQQALALVLAWLDHEDILRTTPEERLLEPVWESPLPQDETRLLENALIKRELGVPTERILAELGYDTANESKE